MDILRPGLDQLQPAPASGQRGNGLVLLVEDLLLGLAEQVLQGLNEGLVLARMILLEMKLKAGILSMISRS